MELTTTAVFITVAAPLLLFLLFLLFYKLNRASLLPSMFFTAFLFTALLFSAFYSYEIGGSVARAVLLIIIILTLFLAVFGVYALIAFLLINARAVLKRETRTLANSLTLLSALALIVYLLAMHFLYPAELPIAARIIVTWVQFSVICYAVHVTQYIVATILCNLSRPKKNQDYIIVHGSGLKDGKVTPLLAGRIDKAIDFYNGQKLQTTPPKLILSGGQGADEPEAEAKVMAEYAEAEGIERSDILIESRSVNTLQNMVFSKEIMDADSAGRSYRAIYATSNYHLLRTGIYARKAGMRITGIGSKTAFYYLPTALLREYIAYVVMHRVRHTVFAVLALLLSAAVSVLTLYYG